MECITGISYYFTHQMLDAIKHVTDRSSVFQRDSAPVHHVCNTVQLLLCKILNFLSPALWSILHYSPE